MLDCAVKTSARNTCIGCCIGCSAAPALAGVKTQIAARNRPTPCTRRRCRVLRLPRIVSGMPLRLCWLAPAIPPVIRRGATPRIGRLYSQAESRRKSPDRERGCGSAGSIAEGSFSIRLERQGIVRQVFETDPRQGDTEFLFRAGHGRQHDLGQKIGPGMRYLGVLDGARRAQNIVGGHAPSIACKLVTAARAADAF